MAASNSRPIPPEAAWRRLEGLARPLPAVTVERREGLGRVLARGVAATVDVPAHDLSAMDGFALAGAPGAGDALPVSGAVMAGDPPGAELPGVSAVRIMTGAPIPAGTDRVIPVEHATLEAGTEGGERVRFDTPGEAGAHIRRRAEVVRAGDPLLPTGTLLGPGALSLLASHGHDRVVVHRRPRVALVVTGDEVVPPETTPGPGQLRDSHTDFLLAACREAGVALDPLGIAPDDPDDLRRRLESGLDADVLLVSGGVSMGEADLVGTALEELDCEPLFHRVAVQPGKPLLAAVHAAGHAVDGSIPGRPGVVFGLPGNPASVVVGFHLFVRPFLRRLLGHDDAFWHGALAAELAAAAPGAKARDRFLPARIAIAGGVVRATPLAPVGSHDLGAYARASALLRIPAGSPAREAGEACEILPLPCRSGIA